jgi:N-acyl amino acid synthase of PEP-CTERM/exosortase system
MDEYSIAKNFNKYFKVRFADTKELRQAAFKIRYSVYSTELCWEPENKAKMETDDYDDYSYHCLLEHRRTKTFAGCIRLVIPPVRHPDFQLAFEKNCLHSARSEIIDSTTLKRGSFGEISRLAVLNSFRRRKKEQNKPFIINKNDPKTVYTEDERRNFPNIAMGLYLAGLSLATMCNHVGLFVMMEPRLNKRLIRFGLPFLQAGNPMDYHGQRAMFYLEKEGFSSHLTEELKILYNIIHHDMSTQISLLPYTNQADR